MFVYILYIYSYIMYYSLLLTNTICDFRRSLSICIFVLSSNLTYLPVDLNVFLNHNLFSKINFFNANQIRKLPQICVNAKNILCTIFTCINVARILSKEFSL